MKLLEKDECEGCPFIEQPFVPPTLIENSDILFIAQNPGADEVTEGKVLCGKCGAFLRGYLTKLDDDGITYSLSNGVKCFTEGNKLPTKKQASYCNKRLQEEIAYVKPKLIVVLGKLALTAVTGLNTGIKKLNGKILREYDVPVAVCIHPSSVNYGDTTIKDFEKGILPPLNYFGEVKEVEVTEKDYIPATNETVGFDIETDGLKPMKGILKCFAISDGDKAIFIDLRRKDG